MVPSSRARRAGLAAAAAAVPVALAYRFAHVYRVRAGYPHRHPPAWAPDALGLAWEDVQVPTEGGGSLQAWWIPAADAGAGAQSPVTASAGRAPAVVLIHGWESARDRTLPHAQLLHALGCHVLTLDVRGHGANEPELLPLSVGEFAGDARAGAAWLRARPDVGRIGLLGHSMGAAGSLVAAADDPDIDAVIAVASPADPWRLTRETFRLAHLPIPGVVAWPLAWLTTRVYLRPRGHTVDATNATRAVRDIAAPVLLAHGTDDGVVPYAHAGRLAAARRAARPSAVTEVVTVAGGRHSWLYEDPGYRRAIGRFVATHLGGAFGPDEAADVAEAVPAQRLPDPERITTLDEQPGGLRSIVLLARRHETRPASPSADPATTRTPSPSPTPHEAPR